MREAERKNKNRSIIHFKTNRRKHFWSRHINAWTRVTGKWIEKLKLFIIFSRLDIPVKRNKIIYTYKKENMCKFVDVGVNFSLTSLLTLIYI